MPWAISANIINFWKWEEKIGWDKCFKNKLITFLLGDEFRKDLKLQDDF
jgi:hypothetical protein